MDVIPGPRAPRALQTYRWLRYPTELLDDCAARYGEVFRLRCYGDGDMVVLAEPTAIRQVFAADYDAVHQPKDAQFARLLGPSSLFVAEGELHQRLRRAVLPALSHARLREHILALHELATDTVESLPSAGWFDAQAAMHGLLLQTTLQLLFGRGAPQRLTRLAAIFAATYAAFRSPLMLVPIGLQARLRRGPWETLVRLSLQARQVMREELQRAQAQPGREPCVLSSLLQTEDGDGQRLSEAEIVDSLLSLFIAGHDTTANAMSWALDCLTQDRASYTRLQAELAPLCSAGPRWEEILALPFLDAVVREVLRLRPIFPVTTRTLRQPLSLPCAELPAGTVVVPSLYLAQRRPQAFVAPLQFRPARFLGDEPPPFEWMPFGGGLRRCPGSFSVQLQLKVLLATLITRLSLVRQPGPAPRMVRAFISLAPEHGLRLRIVERR